MQRFSERQSTFRNNNIFSGRLAQSVQSIWFTPRGSGVRIPHRPPNMKDNENCPFFISLNMCYCYILYSEKLDKYYIGSTDNLEGRLQRHNTSNHGFTSTGKPWEIKYFESFEDKSLALKREVQLKNWKNRKALEELIAVD